MTEGPAIEEINPSAQVAHSLDVPKVQSVIKKQVSGRKRIRKAQPWDQCTFRLNNLVWHPVQSIIYIIEHPSSSPSRRSAS